MQFLAIAGPTSALSCAVRRFQPAAIQAPKKRPNCTELGTDHARTTARSCIMQSGAGLTPRLR
eukprot:2981477-Alexandrium_andersonii.AAC.1